MCEAGKFQFCSNCWSPDKSNKINGMPADLMFIENSEGIQDKQVMEIAIYEDHPMYKWLRETYER